MILICGLEKHRNRMSFLNFDISIRIFVEILKSSKKGLFEKYKHENNPYNSYVSNINKF